MYASWSSDHRVRDAIRSSQTYVLNESEQRIITMSLEYVDVCVLYTNVLEHGDKHTLD